jgi:hypothetical protein
MQKCLTPEVYRRATRPLVGDPSILMISARLLPRSDPEQRYSVLKERKLPLSEQDRVLREPKCVLAEHYTVLKER